MRIELESNEALVRVEDGELNKIYHLETAKGKSHFLEYRLFIEALKAHLGIEGEE